MSSEAARTFGKYMRRRRRRPAFVVAGCPAGDECALRRVRIQWWSTLRLSVMFRFARACRASAPRARRRRTAGGSRPARDRGRPPACPAVICTVRWCTRPARRPRAAPSTPCRRSPPAQSSSAALGARLESRREWRELRGAPQAFGGNRLVVGACVMRVADGLVDLLALGDGRVSGVGEVVRPSESPRFPAVVATEVQCFSEQRLDLQPGKLRFRRRASPTSSAVALAGVALADVDLPASPLPASPLPASLFASPRLECFLCS